MQIEKLLNEEHQSLFVDDLIQLKSFIDSDESLSFLEQLVLFYKTHEDSLEIYAEIYFSFWLYFRKIGKILLAEKAASNYLDHLLKYKRISKLKSIINELEKSGFSKNKIKKVQTELGILEGDKSKLALCENDPFDWHDDFWSSKSVGLKNEILELPKWNLEVVSKLYEYTLKYHFDLELTNIYQDKIIANEKYKEDYIKLLAKFKEPEFRNNITNKKENLTVDYDQLAFELISGKTIVKSAEEEKVIKSLNLLSYEELLSKGEEMLIAFKMLNMNQVVRYLAERLLEFEISDRQKASISFVAAQSLFEDEQWFELNDFIQNAEKTIPLIEDEWLALEYLKFQSSLKNKKLSNAKKIAEGIMRTKKGYRDVALKLREIEKNK